MYIIIVVPKRPQLYESSSIASRALHHHPQDDGDFDVITAYVMEDANSLNHENELHSGPASIKVRWTARLLLGCARSANFCI